EENWERLEDLLTKATADGLDTGLVILSNILPPPHNLDLLIVKLLTHPIYHSYQSHIATLSLFPRVYLSYIPPAWNATTPPTPQYAAVASKANKEWKRRIKMCLSPAVEAFGFERIIFWLGAVSCFASTVERRRLVRDCARGIHGVGRALTRRALMLCLETFYSLTSWKDDLLLPL
ncbi:hypothetical protein BGY98DRAFT_1168598, partial [Russula aff. rugulosa BPL654]